MESNTNPTTTTTFNQNKLQNLFALWSFPEYQPSLEYPDTSVKIHSINQQNQGAVSIRKTVLPHMAIPMLKIRRPNGRLIFNMEIAIRR